jgi:MYXO-CTERM domain-containing protein
MSTLSKVLLSAVVGSVLAIGPASAFSQTPDNPPPNTPNYRTYEEHRGGGFGWVGLIGLLGLLGLRRPTYTPTTTARDYNREKKI